MRSRPVRMLGAAVLAAIGSALVQAQSPLKPGFDVVNHSSQSIHQIFAKPDGSPNWGSPLPQAVVAPGKTGAIQVPSETNCRYDVRLVYKDGASEEHDKIDICKRQRIETQRKG